MVRLAMLPLFLSTLASSTDAFAFHSSAGGSRHAADTTTTRPVSSMWAGADAAAGEPAASDATDILNSPAFLTRKLDVIKTDIAKAEEAMEAAKLRLQEGKAEWSQQLDDLKKEYQNIQDRMSTQSKTGDSQAIIKVVRQMLEVLDNFDRAFGAVTSETDSEKEIEAQYKEAYDMILASFKELGVEEVETVGIEFDYEYHQAVMQRPDENFEEGIVCEEFQKGFKLGDVLVRAAMVAVAA